LTFSRNWEVDVQHAFGWTREALLRPMEPGSTVIAISSGAALRGSPVSGGYAGAKATIRFLTAYAAEESRRAGLGIRFISVLPDLTPATRLGQAGVAAYAARQGMDAAAFLASRGPALTTDGVGTEIAGLIGDPARDDGAYLVNAAGISPVP
jgi:NADP-dependent 3-hydroxy acid dehydrogenase YdfG